MKLPARVWTLLALSGVAVMLVPAACGNDGWDYAPPDTGTDSGDGDGDGDGDADASFSADVWPMLALSCSCHEAPPLASMNGELGDWNEGNAMELMIDVPSNQSDLDYVVCGDAEASYFMHKIDGTHFDVGGSGLQMPWMQTPFLESERATIRAWINNGCKP